MIIINNKVNIVNVRHAECYQMMALYGIKLSLLTKDVTKRRNTRPILESYIVQGNGVQIVDDRYNSCLP